MLKLQKKFKEIPLQYGKVYLRKNVGSGEKKDRLYVYYKPRGSKSQKYVGNSGQSSFSVLKDKITDIDRSFLRQSLDDLSISCRILLDRFSNHIDSKYESGTYRLKTMETYKLQLNRLRKMLGKSIDRGLTDIEGTGKEVEDRFKERFLEPILDYHKWGTDQQGQRVRRPHKRSTVTSTFSVLGIFLNWCYFTGYIRTDPWKMFGKDWVKTRLSEEFGQMTFQETFISQDEEQVEKYESFKTLRQFYLDSVEGINPWENLFFQGNGGDRQPSPVGHLIIFLQTLTGCRIREIVNMVWYGMMDQVTVEMNGKTLSQDVIRDTYSKLHIDYSHIDIGGKTLRKRGSTREVSLPTVVRPILQDRWNNRNPDSPFVFNTIRSRGNGPITEENILTWFKKFQERIIEDFFSVNDPKSTEEDFIPGLHYDDCKKYVWNLEKRGFTYPRRLTSHDIRSFFITDLLEREIPLEQVSRFVGHSNVNTTRRHYIVNPVLKHDKVKDVMKEITNVK